MSPESLSPSAAMPTALLLDTDATGGVTRPTRPGPCNRCRSSRPSQQPVRSCCSFRPKPQASLLPAHSPSSQRRRNASKLSPRSRFTLPETFRTPQTPSPAWCAASSDHSPFSSSATAPLPSPRRCRRPITLRSGILHPILSILLLLAAFAFPPAAAVSVAFQNCLPDEYRNNHPVLLQWQPLAVDASFNPVNDTHRLLAITVYGNVTGSLSSDPLPPWNSSLWSDPAQTNGKILEEPNPTSAAPKLTTLHTKVDVLTYEPWNNDTNFCTESLTNASCPLGPVFNTSVVPLADLPSIKMATAFGSSYAFSSFSATFIIRYGDDAATVIGCVSATVTPSLGNLSWLTKYLPLLVLLAVGFATVFAAVYSPWGTTNLFHWSSNYGRDPDLLRLVTPGFGDCLQYLQFVVLTGALTLSYPGFYQPIVSQAAWSTLMFNQSFVSHDTATATIPAVADGVYAPHGSYGLQNVAQLVGMANVHDIWPGTMVWLLAITAAVIVLFQLAFALQWIYRFVRKIPEEDLRAKNWPFSVGHVIRIVFNYFLLPLVALTTFQFVVASQSPNYAVALAAITLVLVIGFACWLLYLIISTKPRAVLFDDLPTLLLYGPLYNTFTDGAAPYALVPLMLTLVRGIAIGAVQPAGIAQIVILAICEVVNLLSLHAFVPFDRQSSMNAYHTMFATLRLVTIMLMIAFVPTLGVTEGTKGWIGYVILVLHAGVLVLGFLLNAIQTMLEVIARVAGAGGDDVTGQTRGGLSKIFGMRQLARRMPRRGAGAASRQSQLSSSAMLDSEEANKAGFVMPGGRLRSESAGSIGVLMGGKLGQRSSSALDTLSVEGGGMFATAGTARHAENGESFTPTTTGEMSNFSYLPSPTATRAMGSGVGMFGAAGAGAGGPLESADPYYRPPRRTRRPTISTQDAVSSPAERTRGSWASGNWPQGPTSPGGEADATAAAAAATAAEEGRAGDAAETDSQLSHGGGPAEVYAQSAVGSAIVSPRTDYSTREVDFYYGVRGERLNSGAPNRKLGTGPADPTGPMASATGWVRTLLGGKRKVKGKGFEVVRSARMPAAMMAGGGDFDDDGPPPGVPVAMDVIRNGPIESDDEDDQRTAAAAAAQRRAKRTRARLSGSSHGTGPGEAVLLDAEGNPGEESGVADVPEPLDETRDETRDGSSRSVPVLPAIDTGGQLGLWTSGQSSRQPSRVPSQASHASVVGGDGSGSSGPRGVARLPFGVGGSPELGAGQSEGSGGSVQTAERGGGRAGRLNGASSSTAADSLHEVRPTNVGVVQHGNVGRVDVRAHDGLVGRAAEVVDEAGSGDGR